MSSVIPFEGLHNLRRLLARHDLSPSGWAELPHQGFSGARIYRSADAGRPGYVLKVTSPATDWIMRATSDRRGREALLANAHCIQVDQVHSPAVGAAQDGSVSSILMQDVSEYLLPNGLLTEPQLTTILIAMSQLHAMPPPRGVDVPWCSIENRLTLFRPDPERLAGFRIGADILRGWELFFEHAPKGTGDLVRSLFHDLEPLVRALGPLPGCLLHGDLKLDNIAVHPRGGLSLIDWSMPMIAPAAVELGWFLAMNSRTLPISLDATLAAYTSYSSLEEGLHERHRAATVLCGLLIRGWRKGLDAAAGEPDELRWWCAEAARAGVIL